MSTPTFRLPAKAAAFLAYRGPSNPRYKTYILLAAVVFLIVGVGLSLSKQPQILADLDWRPLVLVVFVGIPVTTCLSTAEFMVTGRLVAQRISFLRALEVMIIGAAANLLPLPGSTLVRLASLKAGGASYRDATAAVLLVAVLWLGIALVYAGSSIWLASSHGTGAAFVVIGAALLLGSALATMRVTGGLGFTGSMMAVKLLMVMADAARLFLCLAAIGATASFAQASALSISAVVGSAVSIVPAGLGIREATAAALAPIVGLSVASGFLAATVNRLLALTTLVPLATLLAIRARRQEAGP